MGASFIFTIGHRYPQQACDTIKAWRHIPLFQWDSFDDLRSHAPRGCKFVAIEMDDGSGYAPTMLPEFKHPARAVYLLGAEDRGIPQSVIADCDRMIAIPTEYSLNVAVAGSIVLYDRNAKALG
jgi:tRNA G18 (ribose-2'-O)-methylase SpoU